MFDSIKGTLTDGGCYIIAHIVNTLLLDLYNTVISVSWKQVNMDTYLHFLHTMIKTSTFIIILVCLDDLV